MLTAPYLTIKDGNHIYVLQRAFPHYLGKVQYTQDPGAVIQGQIPMYNIFIVFAGTLGGNRLLLNDDWRTQLENVWEAMCRFYREERIEKMPGRFKRYKI